MLDNVGLRYPHRASGAKAPRTLRPLPLLRFAVSATGGAHLCSIQYYLRFWLGICRTIRTIRAILHNSKCRYGERGAADAKPKAQIILDAAKVSAASGGNSEPKQGQRSQSARGFCPRSTMRVPQPDIIEHFGNADAVPHTEPQRGASERNRRLRRLLARRSAGAVLKPSGGNCAVLP